MSNHNLRNITNSFQDVRLVSLASWRQANEILPRDRGGPYVVLQEGYDPTDLRMIAEEFVLAAPENGSPWAISSNCRFPTAARNLFSAPRPK